MKNASKNTENRKSTYKTSNSVRGRLCRTIAAFPDEETDHDAVAEKLDPLFEEYESDHTSSPDSYEGGISPILVACDKGNIPCLEYLEKKYNADPALKVLIGDPSEQSIENKNTSMHLSAASGKPDVINILTRIGVDVLAFGTTRNNHGDIPLMMAALHGSIPVFRRWMEIVKQTAGLEDVDCIKIISEAKNVANDTCVTLACCHGHPDLVEMLISLGVSIDSSQLEKCRKSQSRLEHAFEQNPTLLDRNRAKFESIVKGVKILEAELARLAKIAEEIAQQLLEDTIKETVAEESPSPPPQAKNSKKKKRKQRKNKKKAQSAENTKVRDSGTDDDSSKEEGEGRDDTSNNDGLLKLTQLPNGVAAVSVTDLAARRRRENNPNIGTSGDAHDPILGNPATQQSADELFQQRLAEANLSDLKAYMDSLCLEVGMLLYTPHGMALNLSPSQLDAIDGILKKQCEAIELAREIQRRLHETASNCPPGSTQNS